MALDRTYRNNGALAPLPFMAAPGAPAFPAGCVRAVGVCVGFRVSSVMATGVSLSPSGIAVTLVAALPGGGRRTLCTLSAARGEYATAYERGVFSAWLLAGPVPQTASGSYAGEWRLDPAYVLVSGDPGDAMTTVTVNGRQHAVGDKLYMSAGGLLSLSGPDENGVAALSASISDGAGALFRTSRPLSYRMVTRLGASEASDELHVSIEDARGVNVPETADYITADIAFHEADGMLDPAGDADAPDELRAALDVFGRAVTVTLNGHKGLPNCYARDKDEALD